MTTETIPTTIARSVTDMMENHDRIAAEVSPLVYALLQGLRMVQDGREWIESDFAEWVKKGNELRNGEPASVTQTVEILAGIQRALNAPLPEGEWVGNYYVRERRIGDGWAAVDPNGVEKSWSWDRANIVKWAENNSTQPTTNPFAPPPAPPAPVVKVELPPPPAAPETIVLDVPVTPASPDAVIEATVAHASVESRTIPTPPEMPTMPQSDKSVDMRTREGRALAAMRARQNAQEKGQ